jgi:hypothetical protein|tara:strand:- start:230 stop:451 length:222 start_codon:yes stop_codon:yes gene_type:complete
MVDELPDPYSVGDLVRMSRSKRCLGMVVATSDSWQKGSIHHVRVFWFGGDLKDPTSATWTPVKELEIISKITK